MKIVLEFEEYEAMSGYLETPPEPFVSVGDEFTMKVKVLAIDHCDPSWLMDGEKEYWTVILVATGTLIECPEGQDTYTQATLEKV